MKIQKDKVKHFAVSAGLAYGLAWAALLLLSPDRWLYAGPGMLGATGSFLIGLGWEIVRAKKHGFEVADIVANVFGIIFGTLIFYFTG